MTLKIGINGFGRIGRKAARLAMAGSDCEVVAINDLGDVQTSAHLYKYDSVHGTYAADVSVDGSTMLVNGKRSQLLSERDPAQIPWGKMGVDLVLECTGVFTDRDKAALHLAGGAKKVLISAPSKDADITICVGINEKAYDPSKHDVLSNASCTTNALAPVAKVLDEAFGGIKRGLMTTIHAYTNDQRILDLPHKDLRRARAAALSMIPTTTGAAKAIGLVLPHLKGKLDGFSMRVPTPNVSVVDLTAEVGQSVTIDAVNAAMKRAAAGELKGILGYSALPLVSSDFNGDTHSSIFDSMSTQVIDGNLIKVLSWYDNESGFSQRLLDLAKLVGSKL